MASLEKDSQTGVKGQNMREEKKCYVVVIF